MFANIHSIFYYIYKNLIEIYAEKYVWMYKKIYISQNKSWKHIKFIQIIISLSNKKA
jgi:hypothetical protein